MAAAHVAGARAGTRRLGDLAAGIASSNPTGFVAFKGAIYFAATGPDGSGAVGLATLNRAAAQLPPPPIATVPSERTGEIRPNRLPSGSMR